MKIQGQKFEIIKAAMQAVIEKLGVEKIKAYLADHPRPMALIWQIFDLAHFDIQYDDSHPWYVTGTKKRLSPYQPEFKLYSDDVNDDHIVTALKTVMKSLGFVINYPDGKTATNSQKPLVDQVRAEIASLFNS